MDPLNLQRQIRNNSADLLSFCDELKQWGEEMKRKDENLKTGSESTDTEVPLPRNKVKKISEPSKPKPEKVKSKTKPSKSTKGCDYSAWERFDVDAECAKLDQDKNEGDESGDLTDEYDENSHDEAIYEKEKGNKFVKLQKWTEAIECYTKAIESYGYDPIFYANRALCYLKKQNYRAAETDCTNALRLDKTYVKAYQRRAAAREALNQLTDAHGDLLKVFDYEPNNKESKVVLSKLEKKLESFNKEKPETQRPKSKFTISREEHKRLASTSRDTNLASESINLEPSKEATYWPSGNEVELVEAVFKPPHLRSKKPLRRIEICDAVVKFDASNEIREVKTIENFNKNVFAQAWPKPNDNSHVIKCDELKVIERKIDHNKGENREFKEKPKKESKFSKEKCNKKIISNDNDNKTETIDNKKYQTADNKTTETIEFDFPIPETSVQFNIDWRLLINNSEWRYMYLKQVNPKKFSTIFKESLDCDIFSGIIHTLGETFIEKSLPVYEYLQGLCEVKRFSMLAMFMSDEDKKDMFKLFDYMKSDATLTKANIDNLKHKYGL